MLPSIREYIQLKSQVLRQFNINGPQDNQNLNIAMIDPLTTLGAIDSAAQQSKSIIEVLLTPYNLITDLIYAKKNLVGYQAEKKLSDYIDEICNDFSGLYNQRMALETNPTAADAAKIAIEVADNYWKTERVGPIGILLKRNERKTGEDLWLKVSKIMVKTRTQPHAEFILFLLQNSGRHVYTGIENFVGHIMQQMDTLIQDPKYRNIRKKRVD